jgi:hypothetical protein
MKMSSRRGDRGGPVRAEFAAVAEQGQEHVDEARALSLDLARVADALVRRSDIAYANISCQSADRGSLRWSS